MYDDNFSSEQIERVPDALLPEDAHLVRDLQAVYQPEADSHRRSLERVRARLAQQEALGRASLPTQRKRLEGKIISIKEKKIMEDKHASQGMISSMPLLQVKKRGPIVHMVGISLVAAVAIITIVSFTIFSGVLRSAPQAAGNGSSTLPSATGQQQPAQQKEISSGKLVCSVGLDVRALPPIDYAITDVYWSAQGKIATLSNESLTIFSAKDCGTKITKPTAYYEGGWSSDGKKLAVLDSSGDALDVLDKDGNSITNIPFTKVGTIQIGSLVWSSDSTKLTFISLESNYQMSIKTIDAANGGNEKTLMTVPGNGGTSGILGLSPDGKYALMNQFNFSTKQKEHSIWDVNTGKRVSNLPSDDGKGDFDAYAFSPDGSLFAQSGNGKVQVYSTADGKLQASIEDPVAGSAAYGVRDIAWSPNGKYLAVAANSISIVDVNAQKVVTTFGQVDAHHQISSVAWAPDGSGLVSSTNQVPDDGHSQTPVNVWALS